MTVKLEGTIKRYIADTEDEPKPRVGLNIDGLTLTANDFPVGSSLLVRKTGKIYRWNGFDWYAHVPIDESIEYLEAILLQLTAIRENVDMLLPELLKTTG